MSSRQRNHDGNVPKSTGTGFSRDTGGTVVRIPSARAWEGLSSSQALLESQPSIPGQTDRPFAAQKLPQQEGHVFSWQRVTLHS